MSTVEKTEENRYIGGDGKPINLAQTSGHYRVQLTKVRNNNKLEDESDVQLNDESDSCDLQTSSSSETQEEGVKNESNNHCPLHADGQKVKSHIQ